jgi:hypothetical protein
LPSRCEKLLGDQRTQASAPSIAHTRGTQGAANFQQPVPLMTIGADTQLVEELLVFVQRCREVGTLVRIDPDREHHQPPDTSPNGKRRGRQA